MSKADDCAYKEVRRHFIEHGILPPLTTLSLKAKIMEECLLDMERGDFVARRIYSLL